MSRDTVIHYGYLAGIPYLNSNILRKNGVKSKSIALFILDTLGVKNGKQSNRKLPTDQVICNYHDNNIIKLFKIFNSILSTIRQAKLVHYYGGTLLPYNIDALIFKLFKIPMVITFGGTDIRIIAVARRNNKFFYEDENTSYDNIRKKYLNRVSRFINTVTTDPEMEEYLSPYFKQVIINKQPCSFNISSKAHEYILKEKLVLLHIPTRKDLKGTQYFINAVERLKSEGYKFDFQLLEPSLSQKEMRCKILSCDIYLDELRCGAYGMTAIEAIALGKPTTTYIRKDLLSKFPSDLPFVNSNPETVYANLKFLFDNKKEIVEISKKSHLYAIKYHSSNSIKNELFELYKNCGVTL